MVSILIVDDHPVVRDGLQGMFADDDRFRVIGEAADGVEAVQRAAVLEPDVVLMDLRMPDGDGVTAIRALRCNHPQINILVLTTYDTDQDVFHALDAGATGYLLKDSSRYRLTEAVLATARGEAAMAPTALKGVLTRMRGEAPNTLTQRELDVLRVLAQGGTNRQAARTLLVSEATVKTHLARAYAKLGVSDRAAAVHALHEMGIL